MCMCVWVCVWCVCACAFVCICVCLFVCCLSVCLSVCLYVRLFSFSASPLAGSLRRTGIEGGGGGGGTNNVRSAVCIHIYIYILTVQAVRGVHGGGRGLVAHRSSVSLPWVSATGQPSSAYMTPGLWLCGDQTSFLLPWFGTLGLVFLRAQLRAYTHNTWYLVFDMLQQQRQKYVCMRFLPRSLKTRFLDKRCKHHYFVFWLLRSSVR